MQSTTIHGGDERIDREEGQVREVATFCRICEAEYGLVAQVDGDRLVDVRADPDNPHSRGFRWTKPKAMIEIVDDPDRVVQPLKRVGAPEYVPLIFVPDPRTAR